MARLLAAAARILGAGDIGLSTQEEVVDLWNTSDFSGGWYPDIAANRLPDDSLATIDGFTYIRGRIITQNGSNLYDLTAPNSSKILNINLFYDPVTGLNLLRYDSAKIYKATSTGFVEFTPDGAVSLSGGDLDFFSFAQADNRFFFSNNGVDPIREIDPNVHKYKALGNAPRYRYITSAFNRIVGANEREATVDPIKVGWSGDLNYGEWDATVDNTAGSTDLITSPADTSDFITGITNISTFIIIFRQRSIWIGQNQPSSTNPFYFYAALPRLGADMDRCIFTTEHGVVWFNYQTSGVYYWEPPDGTPKELSLKIHKTLKDFIARTGVSNQAFIWASYSFDRRIYSLFVTHSNSSTVTEFQYNFNTDNWTVTSKQNISCTTDVDFPASSITIDELAGTIDGLAGSIDALGGLLSNPTRMLGKTDGTIRTIVDFDGDYNNNSGLIVAPEQTCTLVSKVITVPPNDTIFSNGRLEFIPYSTGTVTINCYDGDNLAGLLRVTKSLTINSNMLNKPQILQARKPIHARRIQLEFTTDACIEPLGALAQAIKSGFATKGRGQ